MMPDEQLFEKAAGQHVDDGFAEFIVSRLRWSYRLPESEVQFRGHGDGGHCSIDRIQLSHNPSLNLIAHEIAHGRQYRRRIKKGYLEVGRKKWHTKQHHRLMRRTLEYIYKHLDNWSVEYAVEVKGRQTRLEQRIERLEAKEVYKLSPQYKLDQLRKREKKLATKLKRTQTALKKVQRRIKIWEKKVTPIQ